MTLVGDSNIINFYLQNETEPSQTGELAETLECSNIYKIFPPTENSAMVYFQTHSGRNYRVRFFDQMRAQQWIDDISVRALKKDN